MRWPHKKPAKVGDHRWNIKYAWLPTVAHKQNANNCTEWDKYTVWLEYYDCHEVYKENVPTATKAGTIHCDRWTHEANYVLDPIIK